VQAARRAGLTLAGFVRGDGFNLYAPALPSLGAMRTELGLGVLHLFCKPRGEVDRAAVGAALKAVEAADGQIVTAAMLGHKCDLAVMALHPDWSVLRSLQGALQAAGLDVVDSYVSITEVSEYAKGCPSTCCTSGCTRRCRRRASRSSASTR
jgi:hypothetical protein